jgi:hypothetical protein
MLLVGRIGEQSENVSSLSHKYGVLLGLAFAGSLRESSVGTAGANRTDGCLADRTQRCSMISQWQFRYPCLRQPEHTFLQR